MGSELSSHGGSGKSAKRQVSEPAPRHSPHSSISSDADIPYISYTINNPIGESPKPTSKGLIRTSSTPSPRLSPKPPRPHSYSGGTNFVVVKEGAAPVQSLETDPDFIHLQSLPTFTPILKLSASSAGGAGESPEVQGGIDPALLSSLCQTYQDYLTNCAESSSQSQNHLASKIREVDMAIVSVRNHMVEKQKKFAKYCEQLSKVHDVSSTLEKCQLLLTETCMSMDQLNEMLPPSERLEPFVMVTG